MIAHALVALLGSLAIHLSVSRTDVQPLTTNTVIEVVAAEWNEPRKDEPKQERYEHESSPSSKQQPIRSPLDSAPESVGASEVTRVIEGTGAVGPIDGLPLANAPRVGRAIGKGRKGMALPNPDLDAYLQREMNRPKPVEPTAPAVEISMFGTRSGLGRSFVFVVDHSNSMGKEGIDAIPAVKRELARQLTQLSSEHEIQLFTYNDTVHTPLGRWLMQATLENRDRVGEVLETLASYGGTNHYQSLLAALRLKPDVIFLFTDGADPRIKTDEARILLSVSEKTRVHCVLFGAKPKSTPESIAALKGIAEGTGGSVTLIERLSD